MKRTRITFLGRESGAIGVFCWQTRSVEIKGAGILALTRAITAAGYESNAIANEHLREYAPEVEIENSKGRGRYA